MGKRRREKKRERMKRRGNEHQGEEPRLIGGSVARKVKVFGECSAPELVSQVEESNDREKRKKP